MVAVVAPNRSLQTLRGETFLRPDEIVFELRRVFFERVDHFYVSDKI